MKHRLFGLLVAGGMTAASLAGGSAFAAGEAHGHGHGHGHASAASAAQLNAGQKWASDEALRHGMTQIRDAVEAKLPAIHEGKLGDAQYEALGGVIDAQLAHIVQNCKLEPAADEALHAVLASMMEGNETLRGRNATQKRTAGVVQVVRSLEQYAELFEHPGFEAPNAGH